MLVLQQVSVPAHSPVVAAPRENCSVGMDSAVTAVLLWGDTEHTHIIHLAKHLTTNLPIGINIVGSSPIYDSSKMSSKRTVQ